MYSVLGSDLSATQDDVSRHGVIVFATTTRPCYDLFPPTEDPGLGARVKRRLFVASPMETRFCKHLLWGPPVNV